MSTSVNEMGQVRYIPHEVSLFPPSSSRSLLRSNMLRNQKLDSSQANRLIATKTPGQVALGRLANKVSSVSVAEAERRKNRYQQQKVSAEILSPHYRVMASNGMEYPVRVCRCGWAMGSSVGFHHSEGHRAHLSGIERCASIHACPVCGAVIRAKRSKDVEQAAIACKNAGGGLYMATLTLKHAKADSLDRLLNLLLLAWKKTLSGSVWKRIKKEYSIAGYIRALEITASLADERKGANFHPHLHILFFTEKPLTPAQTADFEGVLFERWNHQITRLGGRPVSRKHGVDFREAGPGAGLYISKLQEKELRSTALELTSANFKAGRQGNIGIFELLDTYRAFKSKDPTLAGKAAQLWREYYLATKGRRAIGWSLGLRKRYLPDAEKELSDEEIMSATETVAEVFSLHRGEYIALRREPVRLCRVLELLEKRQYRKAKLYASSSGNKGALEISPRKDSPPG